MGRTDPGPQKYKESNNKTNDSRFCLKVPHQDRNFGDLCWKSKKKEDIVRYNTTPADKFTTKHPLQDCPKIRRCQSEHNHSSSDQYEHYLRHNLYIKSAIENQNLLNSQIKKNSIRNYTPKILSQEVNLGMWI
ncbi:uncharacterized protein [Euwallacea similis]|uniref:uncharacterized protein n=1 Tax=Euwallacea similis TaxID=1736056 RepID=UPI00344CB48A